MYKTPAEIIQLMLKNDHYSQWLGIEVLNIDLGTCELKMKLTQQMLNGFSIAHGGISYSFSDTALAFAANSRGKKCVSVETSISHIRPIKENDEITAEVVEKHRGKTLGIYEVNVFNQERKLMSIFKGTVHISDENW